MFSLFAPPARCEFQFSAAFLPLSFFLRWIFGCFPFWFPRLDAKFSLQQLSSPLFIFFSYDGFSVIFPLCSPGPMRSSVFSSVHFWFFFALRWIFSCFPFLLPRPDAKFSLQQRSFLVFFFIRWIFGCFPFVFPPARCEFQFSAAFPPLPFFLGFFSYDGFSDVFPFGSPGLMRSSVFSSFPPPYFFS